jgi:hydrogenase nickel incorporation protein HypA/HybF
MHEMAIAVNIVDLAHAYVRLSAGERIGQVEIGIGPLAGVMQEALQFCFEAAARNTHAEGAQLVIINTKAKARCCGCWRTIDIKQHGTVCPECHGFLEVLAGDELTLRAVTIEEKE